MTNKDLILAYFNCYEIGDWNRLQSLLDEDFQFSSPHDPMLTKEDYFRKCWPFHKKATAYHIDTFLEDKNSIFVIYTCTTDDENNFENAEYFQIENAKIKKVKVFYGTLNS
ncbi:MULTISPECIES: nuclear transport factor 2 family protein [Sphingobacterium]|jgi:hypothetical protein|uniref:nuclear transport factor 2 family protein n=1 Tax=Sphingobacterium TaxID=28453 RepID=UPI00038A399B|nr:nuclear transport factor 2 family protein [Sphingobacterium sp. IITKGP-BTPF85]KKX48705.1 hypothetical protein L950_0219695 [Sphingobacterium sp. IITKGP-BTPF85]